MQHPETPSPVPTVAPGITPTPVTPEPVFYEEVPCSNCTPPDSGGDFAMNDMPVTGTNRTSDADFGILGEFAGWLADRLVDLLEWLFLGHDFSNIFPVYFFVVMLILVVKLINRDVSLQRAQMDQCVLERIEQIDPDLVHQARVEVEHPEFEGRVIIGDWDEDGNSIHDPDRGLRPDYV